MLECQLAFQLIDEFETESCKNQRTIGGIFQEVDRSHLRSLKMDCIQIRERTDVVQLWRIVSEDHMKAPKEEILNLLAYSRKYTQIYFQRWHTDVLSWSIRINTHLICIYRNQNAYLSGFNLTFRIWQVLHVDSQLFILISSRVQIRFWDAEIKWNIYLSTLIYIGVFNHLLFALLSKSYLVFAN